MNCAIEPLEFRRLLSFTLITSPTEVPRASTAGVSDISTDAAVAANGNYIIASSVATGSRVQETETSSIQAVLYDSAGKQIAQPIVVATYPGVEGRFSTSVDADGDSVVAYMGAGHTGEPSSIVFFKRISKAGDAGTDVPVRIPSAGTDEFITSPVISMDSGGGFFVAWVHRVGSDNKIEMQAFDASGVAKGSIFTAVDAGTSLVPAYLHLSANPDGSGAVFAYAEGNNLPKSVAFGRVSTSGLVGSIGKINGTADADIVNKPDVAVYADNSFVIGFERQKTVLPAGTIQPVAGYARKYSASSGLQGSEIEVGAALDGDPGTGKYIRSVTVDDAPDGGFVAGFVRRTGNPNTLYAVRFGADGKVDPSGPVPVDTGLENPVIGADANGNVVVAYRSWAQEIDYARLATSDANIYIEGSELFVLGTEAADALSVTTDGINIVVHRGDTTKTFPASSITAISMVGYGGNDTITNSTALRSTLVGGDGSDSITGGSAADSIRGNSGDDVIAGSEGNDTLLSDGGNDSLSGNAGKDNVQGGIGDDRVAGNGGRDRLFGQDGDDRIFGGASGDWLFAGNGYDQLTGEGGDDRLYADDKTNTLGYAVLHGNAGDDIFITRDDLTDHLFGDGGSDSALTDIHDTTESIEAIL